VVGEAKSVASLPAENEIDTIQATDLSPTIVPGCRREKPFAGVELDADKNGVVWWRRSFWGRCCRGGLWRRLLRGGTNRMLGLGRARRPLWDVSLGRGDGTARSCGIVSAGSAPAGLDPARSAYSYGRNAKQQNWIQIFKRGRKPSLMVGASGLRAVNKLPPRGRREPRDRGYSSPTSPTGQSISTPSALRRKLGV
jgi:hypothetical protein